MARPEPNIFSQKWGNGCAGALASTMISCVAPGESSRGQDSRDVDHRRRTLARAKQRHNFFIRLLFPHEHSRSRSETAANETASRGVGNSLAGYRLPQRRRWGEAPPESVRS